MQMMLQEDRVGCQPTSLLAEDRVGCQPTSLIVDECCW